MSISIDEPEMIRDRVSKLTGARFEMREVRNRPARLVHAIWFMRCREITQSNKIPHVNSLWREDGEIRIESLTIGNASQWIEQEYGEEAVYPIAGMDLTDFGIADFRNEFLNPFPKIKDKLDGYERRLRRISKKYGKKLEVRYDGRRGLVTFYLDAIIDAKRGNIEWELESIETAIRALKEAYQEITEIRQPS